MDDPTCPECIQRRRLKNPDPVRCHWHRGIDGTTTLIPGCWARVHDPDADCLCLVWTQETAAEKIRRLQAHAIRQLATIQTLRKALRAAGITDPTTEIDTKAYNSRRRRNAMHQRITEADNPNA